VLAKHCGGVDVQQLLQYALLAIVAVVVIAIVMVVVDRKDRTINGLTLAGLLLGLLFGWTTRPEKGFGAKPSLSDLANNQELAQQVGTNVVLYVAVLTLVGWIIGFVLKKQGGGDQNI
jgi:Flp pilus assembly protein protease CpaA